MPNWCYNELTLYVDSQHEGKEVLDAFTQESPFQKICPCPEDLLNTVSGFLGKGTPEQAELERKSKENINKYGHANWYDWCNYNWGTKWDVTPDVLDPLTLNPNGVWSIRVSFDSAWCPPDGLYSYINEKFPEITLDAYWEEPGCGEKGTFYAHQDMFDATSEEFTYDDDDEIYEETQEPVRTPTVGAATILPLPTTKESK